MWIKVGLVGEYREEDSERLQHLEEDSTRPIPEGIRHL